MILNPQALRMALRQALMEQAVEQGLTHAQALKLSDRLHTGGTLDAECNKLLSQIAPTVRDQINLHAGAMVMVEKAKTAGFTPHANPCLVLTAGGRAVTS